MCELLVWLRDRETSNNVLYDRVKYVAGDVIVATPDGWDWTVPEKKHPHWVVLRVPDMSLVEGRSLATHEPEEGRRRLFHTRLFNLDLSVHPTLAALTRRHAAGENLPPVTVPASTLRAVRRRKPPAEDPDVLGPHTRDDVLG